MKRVRELASKQEFVEFVAEQLSGAGSIGWRKMFGEYGLYCKGKFFAVIIENQLFVKNTEVVRAMYPQLQVVHRYGAGDHLLVEDVEDRETLTGIAAATCEALNRSKTKKIK